MQIPKGFSFAPARAGHTHLWRLHMSRRSFVGRITAGAAVITSPLWRPSLASAAASDPTPIPQTVAPGLPFHVVLPGMGEPSSINNFRGVVGVAAVGGQGTAIDTNTGATERLLFDVDNRFMKGIYVGAGGQTYEATFAFV
jgi:hypothetical protein